MAEYRFTYRVDKSVWDKFHEVAYRNRRSLNNELDFLVRDFIAKYEKENGEIQPYSGK